MRIVIVEDEAPIREGMAKILNKINPDYELVGTAADGMAGYKMICEVRPDLVILDIQMPKMDGLSMLRKLREENQNFKVLILSAYSDFGYAKQAIELNIENYLLKPVKIPELKKALLQVENNLEKEQSQEKVFSVNSILLGCLNGQPVPDKQINQMMKDKYGFTVDSPVEVFMVWLGSGYESQKKEAREMLEDVEANTVKFAACVMEMDASESLIMVLYRLPSNVTQYETLQKNVVPMLCARLKSPTVCIWQSAEKASDLYSVVKEMEEDRQWNLLLERGTLIRRDEIEKIKAVPLKHPTELEDKACQAVKQGDKKQVVACYEELFLYYKKAPRIPSELKKSVIRFSWAVITSYKNIKDINADLQIQSILQKISEAVSWSQIRKCLEDIFQIIEFTLKEEAVSVSVLVQKAQNMMRKYYDQGITLEEIADRLFVSEEYLSTQFKKETGVTFSETIRKYRIEKVKDLLQDTHLKLNQIAELAGYSDPKYMSKVFKEEVGMLPNEFRKSFH